MAMEWQRQVSDAGKEALSLLRVVLIQYRNLAFTVPFLCLRTIYNYLPFDI